MSSFVVTDTQRALDLSMAPYDVWGTRAHVLMLNRVGVIGDDELPPLLDALSAVEERMEKGEYEIDPSLGAHLTLEREITRLVGEEIGGKVHTARSRNDQVITAQRLYLRDRLLSLMGDVPALLDTLLDLAEKHVLTVMPGYTHMQPAKPTTFAQWALAYADMFARDLERLRQTYDRNNLSPLGAAESYGTSWPIDRELTARLLGFEGVQEIPPDVVASRGEMETETLADLSFTALHMSKMAQDLLLMNTFEFRMVDLSPDVAQRMGKVTGSSIMPQKKNPDVLEVVRANAGMVFGSLFQSLEVLKSLPFGYNRDSRETKETVINGLERVESGIGQLCALLRNMRLDEGRMRQAVVDNYSLATDLADYLAQNYDLPYRKCYRLVGELVDRAIKDGRALGDLGAEEVNALDPALKLTGDELAGILEPERCLQKRRHVGGASAERTREAIQRRRASVEEARAWAGREASRIDRARRECRPGL